MSAEDWDELKNIESSVESSSNEELLFWYSEADDDEIFDSYAENMERYRITKEESEAITKALILSEVIPVGYHITEFELVAEKIKNVEGEIFSLKFSNAHYALDDALYLGRGLGEAFQYIISRVTGNIGNGIQSFVMKTSQNDSLYEEISEADIQLVSTLSNILNRLRSNS